MSDTDDVFYENTLAKIYLDGNDRNQAEPLTHAAGDDDSGVLVAAVLGHQEDTTPFGGVKRDRGGTDPRVTLHDGVILELENGDADTSDYDLGGPVYAEDNQTVSGTQGDGSGGQLPQVGVAYEVLSDSVKVLVKALT